MTTKSKAVYLGNTHGYHCSFTVGKEYDVCDFKGGFIELYDDNGNHRLVKNGAFHEFNLLGVDDSFVTETECEVVSSGVDKNPRLRYYINGHEVDEIEFGNVRRTVYELGRDGIKCDTIKFEVKFE